MSFSEWREVELEEVIELVIDYRGKTPKKLGGDWSQVGYRALSAKNIKTGRIVQEDAIRYLDSNLYTKWMKEEVNRGDILMTSEAPFGELLYWDSDEKIVLSQRLFCLRTNKKVDSKYLYYYMTTNRFQKELDARATGTTVRGLRQPQLLKCKIEYPPIKDQEAIANILSSMDEKIRVNNQINKNLENMAQAIFKQWFVDFEFPNDDGEPYKSSGGEMIESELGMIPKDWEVGSFSEYISSMLGGDWGKDSPQGNFTQKVYCLRGADINDIVAGNKGKMPERYIIEKNLLKKKLNSGNLVVEISGGSPTQSTGRIAYVSNDLLKRYNSPLVATNFCRAIKLKNDEHMEFFYNYWKTFYQNNIFFHYENGTTGIKNLDITSFIERHPIIIPNENIVNMFTRQAKLFYKMHQNYGVENSQIETLRDSLLPKLMSGEIRVPFEEDSDVS